MATINLDVLLDYAGGVQQHFPYSFPQAGTPTSVAVRYSTISGSSVTLTGWTNLADFTVTFTVPGTPIQAQVAGFTITADAPQVSFSITPGREFASGSWPHTPLAPGAAIDPSSATMVPYFVNMLTLNQGAVYALPACPDYLVDSTVPTVRVQNDSTPGSPNNLYLNQAWAVVPMPSPNTFTAALASDAWAVIYNMATGDYWEFWALRKTGLKTTDSAGNSVDEWIGSWGGKMNLRANPGWWVQTMGVNPGAVAAGIPFFAFQVTYQDVLNQKIAHPVGFNLGIGQARPGVHNQPPAQRTDALGDPNGIPEGAIFRFPASINFNDYPALVWDGVSPKSLWRLICEAIRDYGMVAMDVGGTTIFHLEETGHYTPGGTGGGDLFQQYYGFPAYNYLSNSDVPWGQLQLLQMTLVDAWGNPA